MKYLNYLFCVILIGISPSAFAWTAADLWLRRDQQALHAYQQGDPKRAAALFQDPAWKAVANYRAKEYESALQLLNDQQSELAFYNKGNSLAQLGQYEAAIAAYDEALKRDPNDKDAKFNRDLLKKLLKQKKQQAKNEPQSNPPPQQSPSPQEKNQSPPSPSQENKQPNKSDDQQKNNPEQQPQQPQPQAAQQKPAAPEKKPASSNQMAQAQSQWRAKQQLDQIPDDPGGLLRQKFLRDHQRHVENES